MLVLKSEIHIFKSHSSSKYLKYCISGGKPENYHFISLVFILPLPTLSFNSLTANQFVSFFFFFFFSFWSKYNLSQTQTLAVLLGKQGNPKTVQAYSFTPKVWHRLNDKEKTINGPYWCNQNAPESPQLFWEFADVILKKVSTHFADKYQRISLWLIICLFISAKATENTKAFSSERLA